MTVHQPWNDWIEERLAERRENDLLRSLQALKPISPVRVTRKTGDELILFSSNDYLGLSGDDRVVRGVIETVQRHGLGPRGSPLICGYSTLHQRLEDKIARWKGTEAALLCPTGFSANLAVISALSDESTTIFSDALNHASIIDGCTLAKRKGAHLKVYPHRDVGALETMLQECSTDRALVVSDSVFSMDGELAPLRELAELCERYNALFVIDEAHGSFAFGDGGRGLADAQGVADRVDVHVATLSKGAGGLGGFIATTASIKSLLLNLGRSYIYSTAAPLSVIGGLLAAIDVVTNDDEPQARLWRRIKQLGDGLNRTLHSPIVPIVIGDKAETLEASAFLRQRGIDVTAIRPPTVPPGTSRLRITVSAAHGVADIERLIHALRALDEHREEEND